MSLISLSKIRLNFGGPLILDGLDLSIDAGEKVCLLGRNGAGKSTLMKVIAGEIIPDSGGRALRRNVRITRLSQEVPPGIQGTVFEVVADGLDKIGELVKAYHAASSQLQLEPTEQRLEALARAQHELEALDGWQTEQWVETLNSRLSLQPDKQFDELSGGLKRRVLLARALVTTPDLLLLDEPTNHLDIDAISWLEEFLVGYKGAVLFVAHDRSFLQNLATRILELDRGHLTDWPGDYRNFLRRREELLNAEAKETSRFDKKLAQEEHWIRQGVKARRTRNEGRVRALKAMREMRRQRLSQIGTVNLQLQPSEKSGKLVAQVENVSFSWQHTPIVKELTTTIIRGDRIGIIGPNGIGKTTLIQLLLGLLSPDSGKVKVGTRLEVAYFDQLRSQLDEEKSVLDNVADGRDQITVNGKTRHVYSYLQDFLFDPERARIAVEVLSGGERNRLLLARLFARPANVIVMDEPTNDLDVETLELLEEMLMEFSGTLLLVSHDRTFLNNVVTSCLVFEGSGTVQEYIGGYDDWRQQRAEAPEFQDHPKAAKAKQERPKVKPSAKLTYKEARELESLPEQIEGLEAELESLKEMMADPAFYQREAGSVVDAKKRWHQAEEELKAVYERWAELEARASLSDK